MPEENDFFYYLPRDLSELDPNLSRFCYGVFQNFYNLVVWGAFAIVLKKCQQIRSLMRMVIRVIKMWGVQCTVLFILISQSKKQTPG